MFKDIQEKVDYIRSKVSEKDKEELLKKENVHSVGIGFEEGKPKKAKHVCLTVRVTDKKAKEKLKHQDIVPSKFLSVKTDVIEEEIPTVDDFDGNPGNDDRLQTRVRESVFDTLSGGLAGSGGGNATVPGTARLIDSDEHVVTITNRHVACDEDEDCTGNNIVQPTGNQNNGRKIGTIKQLGEFYADPEDNTDVAVIEMDETAATVSNRYYGLGKQKDFDEPELGQRIVNTGRRTGLISGEIIEVDATSTVGFNFGSISFTDVVRYDAPTDGGDSGSVTSIVDSNGDVTPICCHFAASSVAGVGMPFSKIQDKIGNLSVPSGNYSAPSSDTDIELIEPFCYDVSISGDDITIDYIVSNTGGVNFNDTVELLDENDNLIDSTSYSNISPGDFTSDSFVIDSEYNDSELTLKSSSHIDYVDLEEEEDSSFEANYIPEIVNTNSPVVQNEEIIVEVSVENTTDSAEGDFLDLIVDGELEDYLDISFLGDEFFSFTYQDETLLGEVEIFVETFNSQNNDSTTVIVEEDIDSIFQITIDSIDTSVLQEDDVEVEYTVENLGSNAESDISLYLDGEVKDSNSSVNLSAGESTSNTLIWSTTDERGEYTLRVDADDVDSNSDERTVEVQKPATYEIEITETNSPVKIGNALEVFIEIENTGDLNDEKSIFFTVSDYEEEIFSFVNPNDTRVEKFEWETDEVEAGNYTVQVQGENDSDSQSIEVREPFPAFFQTSIVSINSPVRPNSNLNVEYNVENRGEESAIQDIEFKIEDNVEIVEENVQLNPDEEFESEFLFEVQEEENQYSGLISSDDSSSEFFYEVEQQNAFDFPIIDQDWDDIAIDDGTISLNANSYKAKLYPINNNKKEIESEIDSISYSTEVNSATGISVEIEPKEELNSEEYLGSILDVFVDQKPLFSGRVYKINTSQTEGNFYTVSAEPPGKELRNQSIEETTDNYLVSDYIAKKIDKYNDWDDEHFNLINTEQESLNDINIIGRGREALSDNSEISYSNVGPDASIVDILYCKISVEDSVNVIIETDNSSYNQEFSDSEGTYGEWFKIKPFNLDSEFYDIKFEMSEGSAIFDWISLTSSQLTRTIEPEVVEGLSQKKLIQKADLDEEFEEILEIEDTDPYKIENGKLIPLKTSFTAEGESSSFSGITNVYEGPEYSGGEAYGVGGDSVEVGDGFSISMDGPEYDIEEYSMLVRGEWRPNYYEEDDGEVSNETEILVSEDPPREGEVDIYCEVETTAPSGGESQIIVEATKSNGDIIERLNNTASDGSSITLTINESNIEDFGELNVTHDGADSSANYEYMVRNASVQSPGFDLSVNGNVIETFSDGARLPSTDLVWVSEFQALQSELDASDTIDIELEIISACGNDSGTNCDDFSFNDDIDGYGTFIWDVITVYDERFEYNFDNEVHEPGGYLDGPEPFPINDFPRIEFNEVSTGEVIETGYLEVDIDDPNGVGELGISFDGGDTYITEEDTDSIEKNNIGLTASIKGRIGTKGWQEEPRDETPRLAYLSQQIDLYEMFVDTNTVEILFDKEISGNRLKVITDIVDQSRMFYRWEGKDCRIFQRGSRITDIDLKKEDISSSVSIEDVYSSCEVIGDGVSSGIIEADESPEFINRHKEIRDPDITLEDDAIRRARSFLQENSSIEYGGSITTMPTLAPLGEQLPENTFNHGKNTFIESVRYGKRRSDIECGRRKDISTEILDLDRGVDSGRRRETSK